MGRYASLNQNIYVKDSEDPTSVDVDHAAHAYRGIGRFKCFLSE